MGRRPCAVGNHPGLDRRHRHCLHACTAIRIFLGPAYGGGGGGSDICAEVTDSSGDFSWSAPADTRGEELVVSTRHFAGYGAVGGAINSLEKAQCREKLASTIQPRRSGGRSYRTGWQWLVLACCPDDFRDAGDLLRRAERASSAPAAAGKFGRAALHIISTPGGDRLRDVRPYCYLPVGAKAA